MKSDSSPDPRHELEARLSALILGQLPEEQATELRQQLARDLELLKLYHRLQSAVGLIREATATADPAKSPAPLPRLSHQRREHLLASFKTISPDVRARSRWSFKSWAVPAAAAAMIMILGAGLLPSLSKAKSKAQVISLLANRRLADMASEKSSAGSFRFATDLGLSSAVTAPPSAPTLAATEVRSEVPQVVAPSAGVTFTVGSSGGGMGGGGGGATRSPDARPHQLQGGAIGLAEEGGGGGISPPPDVAHLGEVRSLFRNSGDGAVASGGAAPPQIVGYVNVDPASSSPTVPIVDPVTGLPIANNSAGENALSSEAKVEVGKKISRKLGAEFVQEGLQIVTNGLENGSANTSWGDYDSGSHADLKINNAFMNHDSQKLTESSAKSLGYGVALKDDSGIVLGRDRNESVAKDLPGVAQKSAVAGDTLARYGGRSTLDERFDKTPATTPATAAFPSQLQVARQAENLSRKPANGPSEIQLGKTAQIAATPEGKSDNLALLKEKPQEEKYRAKLESDLPAAHPAPPAPVPQPEILTHQNRFSTFSMNVSDVSFKLAAAALEKGVMPDASTIRSEEFLNAFNYHDPEPASRSPLAFAWEIARSPFAHNRDLIRFSVKTAAQGRQQGRPLNVVVLLDNSGSMERADRVRIIQNAFRSLSTQLQPQDRLSIVLFARTAKLWVDGVAGDQAASLADGISNLVPQGGTNLEEAMNLAYQTALRHYLATGINRVILLTDGAANLGDVDPAALKQKVESYRTQGIALDCFGIGWEGYNDELMENLSRNGDGRYGFINTPEEANSGFASQLAGALHVAASDVKVQVEFNPDRVNLYRQIGYAKHQLTKEQFRDNTVDAAEIGVAESGNALYSIEVNPSGLGPIATLRVRYKVPGTSDYKELEWMVPFNGNSPALEQASPAMKLATTASAFSEWLAANPHAGEVTSTGLLKVLAGVPEVFPADAQPKQLEWMIRQAQSLSGK